MPYPIFRMEKCKGGRIAAMNKHHERTKERYKSNPDIDASRTHLNYHLIQPKQLYKQEVDSRIEKAGCKTRKDSVRMIDVLIGATPEFLNKLPEAEIHEYFSRALDFLKQEIGEQNIFTAIVHRDERTQHMHVCFTPITKEGRLSTRIIFGGRAGLVGWQDRFHACMSERWPELERGQSAALTRRKHLPVQLFKQAKRLEAQMEPIRAAIDDITVFNAGRKKEEALALLSKWLPYAEAFTEMVRRNEDRFKVLEAENKGLEQQIERKTELLDEAFVDVAGLRETAEKQRKLLDKLPPDVLKELRNQPSRGKSR